MVNPVATSRTFPRRDTRRIFWVPACPGNVPRLPTYQAPCRSATTVGVICPTVSVKSTMRRTLPDHGLMRTISAWLGSSATNPPLLLIIEYHEPSGSPSASGMETGLAAW